MDKATANLIFTGICAVFGIVSAVFGYPHWAEWRERKRQERGGGAMKPRFWWGYFGTASVVLLTASTVFAGEWLYFWIYSAHPRLYWLLFSALLFLIVILWWLLASTLQGALQDASAIKIEIAALSSEHERQIQGLTELCNSSLARESQSKSDLAHEQRGFQQMVLKKDQECTERLTELNAKLLSQFNMETTEWKSFKDLFEPLQLEAFQLAKELREWLTKLGPRPFADKSKFGNTPEGVGEFSRASFALQRPWQNRLIHEYADKFAPRLDSILRRLAAESLRDFALEAASNMASDELKLLELTERLPLLAVKLSYPADRRDVKREI